MGILTDSDRIAQAVVKGYLEPELEEHFHPDSNGYRPGKAALEAVGVARHRCWQYTWVPDLVIRALHFTPTDSSWINLVKPWFATLTERQLRRGVHRNTRELEAALQRYVEAYNQDPKAFTWTKTADEILQAVARFRKRTYDSEHQRRSQSQ